MFPLPTPRRVAEALIELADAALQPAAPDPGAASERPAPAGPTAHRSHPHRAPVRIERARRRGAPLPRAQHCISPVSRATQQKPRTAAGHQ